MANLFTVVDCGEDINCKRIVNPVFCIKKPINKSMIYSRLLFIIKEVDGIYLERYNLDFEFMGDTLHLTIDEAVQQATYEYGELKYNWIDIPMYFGEQIDHIDYAKSILFPRVSN